MTKYKKTRGEKVGRPSIQYLNIYSKRKNHQSTETFFFIKIG